MPGLRDAALRHAKYFVNVLKTAAELYQAGGESVLSGLKLFDAEWANIHRGQAWAASNAESDEAAMRLSSTYPETGIACLELRLPPRQRINWLETALTAARALHDNSAEANHLGNLGVAYSDLGEPRRAIERYELALHIASETNDRQ